MEAATSGGGGHPYDRCYSRAVEEEEPGNWIAVSSALLAMLLAVGTVGVYAYGRSVPAELEVAVEARLDAEPDDVWEVISDPSLRPEWRPFVDRVGRIEDSDEGLEVWRELDHSGDRFDFSIVERAPGQGGRPSILVMQVASQDQIGMAGRWHWEIRDAEPGSVIVLSEFTAIENPLWRGLNRLTGDPFERVETEVGLLAEHLQSPVAIDRL